MTTQPAVSIGQVWEEVDPRLYPPRRVTVIDAPGYVGLVRIRCGNRRTTALRSRFNGKRGGYRFVKERAE